jgi:hypothetical protein
LFLPLFLMIAPSLHAQFGGSLNGTVTDTSGAVISGATVTLANPATGTSKTATTNATGFYSFTELAPGSYTVKLTANGFKEQDYSSVAVSAEQPRGLDVKMTAGGASETVTVNGNQTPLLNTGDANTSSTIGSNEVTRLPAFGRDPYELLRTGVGITGVRQRRCGCAAQQHEPEPVERGDFPDREPDSDFGVRATRDVEHLRDRWSDGG